MTAGEAGQVSEEHTRWVRSPFEARHRCLSSVMRCAGSSSYAISATMIAVQVVQETATVYMGLADQPSSLEKLTPRRPVIEPLSYEYMSTRGGHLYGIPDLLPQRRALTRSASESCVASTSASKRNSNPAGQQALMGVQPIYLTK